MVKTSMMILVSTSLWTAHTLLESRTQAIPAWAACWWMLPDVAEPAVLTQPSVTGASASQGACRPLLASCPHGVVRAGLTETETTQAFQSGTKGVYRAAEQPSSRSPHNVSGSLTFIRFVGRKIWVYVCTYNIWQQGDIQIQLWWMLFAWVTVLAVSLFQRLLSEGVLLVGKKHCNSVPLHAYWFP